MSHDVFSHDAYMCSLISRGDLVSPLEAGEGESTAAAADTSDDRINDELGAIAKQIADSNRMDEGEGEGFKDSSSSTSEVWRYNRHWQYTYQAEQTFIKHLCKKNQLLTFLIFLFCWSHISIKILFFLYILTSLFF